MQVWVVCFVVFFGLAELYQWIQGLTLPMPVFAIAGVLLAIASNPNQWNHWLQRRSLSGSAAVLPQGNQKGAEKG